MKETRLIRNLQNVSVSEGKTPAIALPETQLPPQIIIETTTVRLNSTVLFALCVFTNCHDRQCQCSAILRDVLIRQVYLGTSISSYPLPVLAIKRMRSGFIRITTYSGCRGVFVIFLEYWNGFIKFQLVFIIGANCAGTCNPDVPSLFSP